MLNSPSLMAILATGALIMTPAMAGAQDQDADAAVEGQVQEEEAQETIEDQEPSPVQQLPEEGEPDPLDQAEGQAQECRENLAAFVSQLDQEGFWVTGWGTTGFGPGAGAMTGPAAQDPAAAPAETGPGQAEAWGVAQFGGMHGYQSPRGQIRQLYGAAMVFAEQNNQEACDYVLGQMSATYERYRTELDEAGVQPQQVVDWRQEQIALAEPVTETEQVSRYTVDMIQAADVRSRADENLGSVNDVIVDPQSGEVSYVIVARGGFLGFGEELTAVPWQAFAVVPGLNTLILDVEPEHLAAAPGMEGDFWTDDEAYTALIQQADEYWF